VIEVSKMLISGDLESGCTFIIAAKPLDIKRKLTSQLIYKIFHNASNT
jgi:hypothetical protein